MKIVRCKPRCDKQQHGNDKYAADDLRDQCEDNHRFCLHIVFVDEIVRQEVLQRLCESEIIVRRKQSDDTKNRIEDTDIFDRKLARRDYFYNVSCWCNDK